MSAIKIPHVRSTVVLYRMKIQGLHWEAMLKMLLHMVVLGTVELQKIVWLDSSMRICDLTRMLQENGRCCRELFG